MVSYYPPRVGTTKDLRRLFGPQFEFIDEEELDWQDHVEGYVSLTRFTASANRSTDERLAGKELRRRNLAHLVCEVEFYSMVTTLTAQQISRKGRNKGGRGQYSCTI